MGGFIPFPNVPNVPGVPSIPRNAITAAAVIILNLGGTTDLLAGSFAQPLQWGIFDQDGNILGGNNELSTLQFDFRATSKLSNFQIEQGSFANYNKVQLPNEPVITFALGGSDEDRTNFLNALDAAKQGTDLYNVVTPEVTYVGYNIYDYRYQRRSTEGANMLIVDVTLQQIRQISAAYTQANTSTIQEPKDAGSTPQVSNGKVQSPAPEKSTLKTIANKLGL